jgi:hypothetical protein
MIAGCKRNPSFNSPLTLTLSLRERELLGTGHSLRERELAGASTGAALISKKSLISVLEKSNPN